MESSGSTALVISEEDASRFARPGWCDVRHDVAAWALAAGKTKEDAAGEAGVCVATVYNWLLKPDYQAYVDNVTMNTGVALRAERMRRIKNLLELLKDEPLSRRLSRHDEVDVVRLAREEGLDVVQLPVAVQAGRATFIGTQVNVHDLTVMSGSPAPEPSGDAVEGEVKELGLGEADPVGE